MRPFATTPDAEWLEVPTTHVAPEQLPGVVWAADSSVTVRVEIVVPEAGVSVHTIVAVGSVKGAIVPSAGLVKETTGAAVSTLMVLEAVYVVLAAESVRPTTKR